MEKLRRVLTGQDDEEQGLTAQVPPGRDPFFLPRPRTGGLLAAARGAGGRRLLAAGPHRCPRPQALPCSPRCLPAPRRVPLPEPVSGGDGAEERGEFAACAGGGGLWAAGPARE